VEGAVDGGSRPEDDEDEEDEDMLSRGIEWVDVDIWCGWEDDDCARYSIGAEGDVDPEACLDGVARSAAAGLAFAIADADPEYGGIARGGDDRREYCIGGRVLRSSMSIYSMDKVHSVKAKR
jgi:hypothetical protein